MLLGHYGDTICRKSHFMYCQWNTNACRQHVLLDFIYVHNARCFSATGKRGQTMLSNERRQNIKLQFQFCDNFSPALVISCLFTLIKFICCPQWHRNCLAFYLKKRYFFGGKIYVGLCIDGMLIDCNYNAINENKKEKLLLEPPRKKNENLCFIHGFQSRFHYNFRLFHLLFFSFLPFSTILRTNLRLA